MLAAEFERHPVLHVPVDRRWMNLEIDGEVFLFHQLGRPPFEVGTQMRNGKHRGLPQHLVKLVFG